MTRNRSGRPLSLLACLALLATASPAVAHHKPGHQGGPPGTHERGWGGGQPHGAHDAVTISPSGISVRLDDTVIRIVNDWYRANPVVFAGYPALPPGIARNLARGKPLPPGIAKQFLPAGLEAMLPPPPAGYGRFIIGDDLVLIELNSGLIADIAQILF
jgi:hypothetical protein